MNVCSKRKDYSTQDRVINALIICGVIGSVIFWSSFEISSKIILVLSGVFLLMRKIGTFKNRLIRICLNEEGICYEYENSSQTILRSDILDIEIQAKKIRFRHQAALDVLTSTVLFKDFKGSDHAKLRDFFKQGIAD